MCKLLSALKACGVGFFFFYCIYTHLSDYPDKICYSRERRYVTDHKWIAPFSGIPQVQNTMNSLDQGLKKLLHIKTSLVLWFIVNFFLFSHFRFVFSVTGFCRCF